MKLCICASSAEIPKKYLDDCANYLEELFKHDNTLIFGAYNKSLMGIAYEKALKYNNQIIGVTPEIFKKDLENIKCHKNIITKNITERTEKMFEESDAIIFLPGGIGTMHELFTAIEKKRSGESIQQIIIYNSNGYFDKLLLFLEEMYNQNFCSINTKTNYYVSTDIKDTLKILNMI